MALLMTHRTMVLVFGGHASSIDGIAFFRRGPVVRRLPRLRGMAFNLTDIGGIGGRKTLNSAFSSPPTTRQVCTAGRSKSGTRSIFRAGIGPTQTCCRLNLPPNSKLVLIITLVMESKGIIFRCTSTELRLLYNLHILCF
ncbi:unnamed protein product [Musa acuminata subsp. burmannicoides]